MFLLKNDRFISPIIDYIVINMVDNTWSKKIDDMLMDGEPHFQEEIRTRLGNPDRAILTGYLRCLVDNGTIESKDNGRTKIYFKRNKVKK